MISVEPSGTLEVCGPRALTANTPGERTTYRSANPPAGLPNEFSTISCPGTSGGVGTVWPARRTGSGTGSDNIYIEPIETAGQWLGMAGVVGMATALIMTGVGSVKGWWEVSGQRRRERAKAARHGP